MYHGIGLPEETFTGGLTLAWELGLPPVISGYPLTPEWRDESGVLTAEVFSPLNSNHGQAGRLNYCVPAGVSTCQLPERQQRSLIAKAPPPPPILVLKSL